MSDYNPFSVLSTEWADIADEDRMDPQVKDLWLTALRSGDYPQGRGALQSAKGYCCLGVLADLAAKEGVIPAPVPIPPDRPRDTEAGVVTYAGSEGYLPRAVSEWAELDSTNPDVTNAVTFDGARARSLAELNDFGASFDFIADVIECQL